MFFKVFELVVIYLTFESAVASWVALTQPASIRNTVQGLSQVGTQICKEQSKRGMCGLCTEEQNIYHGTKTVVENTGLSINSGVISVSLSLKSNPRGCAEFRICEFKRGSTTVNTINCARQEPLSDETGSRTMFHFEPNTVSTDLRLKVPKSVNCSTCVLQLKYFAGMDMNSGSTSVKTIYDCARINFVKTKIRARRQVTGNSMAGVIFGPNRPNTRFRFSDVPLSRATNVITTRQVQGTRPVTVHHIVMASGTNQTSETRSESGNEASVKLLTISRTGNVASSERRSITSESTENQVASGIRSNKILVQKGQPTVGRTVVLNINRETAPTNTNVLIASRNENLVKTDDLSLQLAPTNANVLISSGRENLAKLDDPKIKIAPTNVNVLTISSKENQAKIDDASIGIKVPSGSPGDSNVLVTATGINQGEYNSMSGVLPSSDSRLIAMTPRGDTSSRSVSALTPSTNTKLYIYSGNTQQSNRKVMSGLPEMRESVGNPELLITARTGTQATMSTNVRTDRMQQAVKTPNMVTNSINQNLTNLNSVSKISLNTPQSVNSMFEITANRPRLNINTESQNSVNSNSVVTAGENTVGTVGSVRVDGRQDTADNSVSGARLGESSQASVRTVVGTVRLHSPSVDTNMLISRQGNMENTNLITDTARLETPAVRSDILAESRSAKQNVANVNAVSGIGVQQSPSAGTTIDITVNRPSINTYLETPNTASSNFKFTSPGNSTRKVILVRGNQALPTTNTVSGIKTQQGNLVNTRTVFRNDRVQLPSVSSNLLLSGRQNLENSNIMANTVRQESPAIRSDILTVSRSAKQNVANMNSVSDNGLQRFPSASTTLDITINQPNMDIYSDTQNSLNLNSIVTSRENAIGRADASLVEGYQEQSADSSVLGTTIEGGRQSNAGTVVRTVRLQSPSVSSNLLTAANQPNSASSNSIITSQRNRSIEDSNAILVDANQAKPADKSNLGAKEDPRASTESLLRTVRLRSPSVSSDILDASRRNLNINIITDNVKQEPPAIRSNMFMTSRGGIKEVTGDDRKEPALVKSKTIVAIRRGDVNKLNTINKTPSLLSERSNVVRVASKVAKPVDRFNLNVLTEYAQDNANNTLVVNALKKSNAHSVSPEVVTASRERNQVDLIGDVTPKTDEKTRVLTSNIITDIRRPYNRTRLIYNKALVSDSTNITVSSADLAGTGNFSEFSNFSGIMTTSIPLEWAENGTYFENGTYYTNYTEYGNYSYYSNETLYPDYASMYENETIYGNYSYYPNETLYSDNGTVFETETGYSSNMTNANVTIVQETKVNATDITTIDINLVPIRNETLVIQEPVGNQETRTDSPGLDTIISKGLVPTAYDSATTLTRMDSDLTVSVIPQQNATLTDSVTNVSEEPVLTEGILSDVASISADIVPKLGTPTPRVDAFVTPATDPTVPTLITSIAKTATDKYSNINFENIRPGRVSYLPDYKNYIDDHGGVPIMIEGNEGETVGTGSVVKSIETNVETTVLERNRDINTIDESPINSNEKDVLTDIGTQNKVLINTPSRTMVDDSIVRTPKVLIAYPVDTIDSNSVAIGQWDNKANTMAGSSVNFETAGMEGSIAVSDTHSNSLVRDIIRELNIVSRSISEEKLPDDNVKLLDLTSVKLPDTSLINANSGKSNDVNMPPIVISYPRDSPSVAIGMGVSKELEDKNIKLIRKPVRLETDLTGVAVKSDETPGPSLKDRMDAEILQTGGIDPPPIIVPPNVLLTNEAVLRPTDMDRSVLSVKPVQDVVGTSESETNVFSEEIASVTMPPIFMPTSRPRTQNSYPGYNLINMVNNDKAIKASYDFFDANNIEKSKQTTNIPKTDILMKNDVSVGLGSILYPIETIKPEYTVANRAKSGSGVKTIWKGPGITIGAASLQGNARRTVTSPTSRISFRRLRPPSIRPKDAIQTLDNQNILNLDERVANMNNMRLINSISSAMKTSGVNSNAIVDSSSSKVRETSSILPEITPEYIAYINSNIQLINDELMNSIKLNGQIKSAPAAEISITQGQTSSAMTENPGTDISIKERQNSSTLAENITVLSSNKGASKTDSTSVTSGEINSSEAKVLPAEEINVLTSKTTATSKETTSELQNKSQLLFNDTTKASITILNSTKNQSNEAITDSVKPRVSGLNSAQFDDISLQILQTLQTIVQELQLNRDLVMSRQNLLQSKQASTNDQTIRDSLAANNVVSKNEIRGNSFDLAQDVPGVERKIGNVNTLATNLDLVNKRLSGQGMRDDTNTLLQVHSDMLSIFPGSSQRGVATNAQARRQDWLRTGNLVSMADVRPWLSNQEDNTLLGGLQGLAKEKQSKIDVRKNSTVNDLISLPIPDSKTDQASTDFLSNDMQAVAKSLVGSEQHRPLSEFSNSMPLVRMGIVRKGIPIALDTGSFPSVLDTSTRQSALVGDQLATSLQDEAFQSNINTVSLRPQLDIYSTTENVTHNDTTISELGVKNMSPQRSAQVDMRKKLLLATLTDFYNNNKVSNAYLTEPSSLQNNHNDRQDQVYDFSGLTEAQKNQITRGLSNAFTEYAVPNTEPQAQRTSGIDVPVYLCPNGERFSCSAVGVYESIPGMEWWCFNHCRNGPCPKTKCQCTCNPLTDEMALNIESLTMGSKKSSQQMPMPIENSKMKLNASDNESVKEERKKIFKKVITLTLNGSKENAVQVNDKGPEFMVSLAPKIISNSEEGTNVAATVMEPHPADDTALRIAEKSGSRMDTSRSGGMANDIFASNTTPQPSKDTFTGGERNQRQSRLMIIDNRLVCRGIGKFENIAGIVDWCTTMCRQATCPEFVCTCWS